jgi:succinyl-CoA synthetase beta subunit
VRGEAPSDVAAVADAIIKLGAIISSCPTITDIEINPLMVYEQGRGSMAVDVRVLIKK